MGISERYAIEIEAQWLTELRTADLQFTREETRAFFEKRLEKRLLDQTLGMLNGRTEGWVAALQLFQLSLITAEDPDQFVRRYSDSDRSITDYLMDEVVSRQPAEIKDFVAADDVDTAAAFLEDNMRGAIDNDLSRRTLGRWLDMFPKSAVDQNPALGVTTIYQKMVHWDFISIETLIDQAEAYRQMTSVWRHHPAFD